MTNKEKIQSMTEDELIAFIHEDVCRHCKYHLCGCMGILFECILGVRAWLRSEVQE